MSALENLNNLFAQLDDAGSEQSKLIKGTPQENLVRSIVEDAVAHYEEIGNQVKQDAFKAAAVEICVQMTLDHIAVESKGALKF